MNMRAVSHLTGQGAPISRLVFLLLALFLAPAGADIRVEVSGPGGSASQLLPDAGGAFDVSMFAIVLTIAQRSVSINIPMVLPKVEPTGYENIKLPGGRDGGSPPKPRDTKIIVFEEFLPSPGGGFVSIPGVIVIEGRIKSLKEFYSVRLLLMNTSGIFTLTDVTAEVAFPDGGLTVILPKDGIASFGDILPGTGDQPGQKEKEFIIRGDEIGVHDLRVEFGGTLTGPGIPMDAPIAFNGSATTDLDVRGPPTFDVQVNHPDHVTAGLPYELEVRITNTDEIPAMYASLELDVRLPDPVSNNQRVTNLPGNLIGA